MRTGARSGCSSACAICSRADTPSASPAVGLTGSLSRRARTCSRSARTPPATACRACDNSGFRSDDDAYTRRRIQDFPLVAREKESTVTAVEAPVSHLRENPFEIAREQLRRVGETFEI